MLKSQFQHFVWVYYTHLHPHTAQLAPVTRHWYAAVNPCPPPLKDTSETDWSVHKEEFQVNLLAPMHLSVLLLPHFQQKANALIVNVTSIFAFFPLASHPTYSATKGKITNLDYLNCD